MAGSGPSKVALVTGAAQGIGAAVAVRLAEDGHDVAVLDRDQTACRAVVDQIIARGRRALAVACDVSEEEPVDDAVRTVATELGPPLIVVNNAGITRDNLLFRMSTSDWDEVSGVHLRGAFLVTRATQSFMTEEGWGRIVNISSTSALGNRGQANYAAAKAGIQGFTKTLAVELGQFGITVNAVAPGFIETAMTRAVASRLGLEFDAHVKAARARIPVGRVGRPEDVAEAVSFFARPNASYVSGQVLYVAGGPRG